MYGSSRRPSALKMRAAATCSCSAPPRDIPADGELRGDALFNEEMRASLVPIRRCTAQPTMLILPNLDAANILFNVLKGHRRRGVTVGPGVLLGANGAPAHILTRPRRCAASST